MYLYKRLAKDYGRWVVKSETLDITHPEPRLNSKNYLALALAAATESYTSFITASTCVSWRYTPRKLAKHIMVLDCDSLDNMIAACRTLKIDNIGYVVIESSPHHYWVVTNYIGNITDVTDRMSGIPGTDLNHMRLSRARGHISIRATPQVRSIPSFPSDISVLHKTVRRWYLRFKSNFDLHAERIQQTLILSEALANRKVADLASDPAFEV